MRISSSGNTIGEKFIYQKEMRLAPQCCGKVSLDPELPKVRGDHSGIFFLERYPRRGLLYWRSFTQMRNLNMTEYPEHTAAFPHLW